MQYYAKSENFSGHTETVKEHLSKVADLAQEYGAPIGLGDIAKLAGLVHDFGKYSQTFIDVLMGKKTGVDHAICGACYLEILYRGKAGVRPIVEAVNGHHDGLVAYSEIRPELSAIADKGKTARGNAGKEPSINNSDELKTAAAAFKNDFPDFSPPALPSIAELYELASMLYTRMLFSCLVDADYTVSAINNDDTYLDRAEDQNFDPQACLEKLYTYRNNIKQGSTANRTLNRYRDQVFEKCGEAGDGSEGLYTLTAPTGTGKTLALLHFSLRHCLKHGKKRIIIVLPFLSLAEQSAAVYESVIPNVLIDHSQSDLPEEARELAARWSAPFIITTSVRFFESLFSSRPTTCRKLHNIANSVVVFDEAQSLPNDLAVSTLRAVNELCGRYHTTMVFSTATQPDFSALKGLNWAPREILPEHKEMFQALQRVNVEWRHDEKTPLKDIAAEMVEYSSVCVIVNLRRHAREIVAVLSQRCPKDTVFFITTDLCPAHRSRQIDTIRRRLAQGLTCRVVATQCIEAGVDLDFERMYRALAPLDAIIQAAGRCNRNGSDSSGQVTIFLPQDDGRLYPDDQYARAALTVCEMKPPFSIYDPKEIQKYYKDLFKDTAENEALSKAIMTAPLKKQRKTIG